MNHESARGVTLLTPRPWGGGRERSGGAVRGSGEPVDAVVEDIRVRLHLTEAGLACCAVEQSTGVAHLRGAVASGGLGPMGGADPAAATEAAAAGPVAVLVVSGTVTDTMAGFIVATYERLPEPRAVVSFGACACTGGPYWDSPVVTNGIDQLLPVDAAVPGCPPRPETLRAGIAQAARSALARWPAATHMSGADAGGPA